MVWIFHEGKEVPFSPGQWVKSSRAFVIPLLSACYPEALSSVYCWPSIPSFKSWRAKEVPLWIWKGKIFPYPLGFYCPPPIPVIDNHIFGCFKYKSKTTPKGPFAESQFPPMKRVGGRGREKVPLGPPLVLFIGVAGASWGREIERKILRPKGRGAPGGRKRQWKEVRW